MYNVMLPLLINVNSFWAFGNSTIKLEYPLTCCIPFSVLRSYNDGHEEDLSAGLTGYTFQGEPGMTNVTVHTATFSWCWRTLMHVPGYYHSCLCRWPAVSGCWVFRYNTLITCMVLKSEMTISAAVIMTMTIMWCVNKTSLSCSKCALL